jgi:putative transposase
MKKRFTDEQIVGILREHTAGQKTVEQICRKRGVSENTFYTWKRKFGSMSKPDVKRARELEKENARLKRLLAERDVEIDVMKEIIEKKLPM